MSLFLAIGHIACDGPSRPCDRVPAGRACGTSEHLLDDLEGQMEASRSPIGESVRKSPTTRFCLPPHPVSRTPVSGSARLPATGVRPQFRDS